MARSPLAVEFDLTSITDAIRHVDAAIDALAPLTRVEAQHSFRASRRVADLQLVRTRLVELRERVRAS